MIIETGAGTPGANSFLYLEEARVIAATHGIALHEEDEKAAQQLVAAFFLLAEYEPKISGSRTTADQSGIFPRRDCYQYDFLIKDNAIPANVLLAQVQTAGAINAGLDLNSADQQLTGFNVAGVYSETYAASSGKASKLPATAQLLLQQYKKRCTATGSGRYI